MRRILRLGVVAMLALGGAAASAADAPRPVKVVVVAMFEHGEVAGDRPGEFQFWVERLPLDEQLDFPLGLYPLRANDDGVLGICIGGGTANAAASIVALGLDPRFDLSNAYWLIAGIAGGDPTDTSLGSAVWAQHVVDGDLLYEIDGREIPADWPYGLMPLGTEAPAQTPADLSGSWSVDNVHFALNPALAQWAVELTVDAAIADSEALRTGRSAYEGYPNALAPPRVMLGDTLASSTYWHGELMNNWANDWVRLYGGDGANFVTTNMEDSGTLAGLARLAATGRAQLDRVMVLRTVSNYSMPPPGRAAAWSATAEYPGNGVPALESAYRVGSVVVRELLTGWDQYSHTPPGPTTRRGSDE